MIISEVSNEILLTLVLGTIGTFLCIWLSYSSNGKSSRHKNELAVLSDNLWIESPLIKSDWLSSLMSSNIVNLKIEALQPSGSFKIRGISTYMKQQYIFNNKIDTFVTTSSANAGMAVCYTAYKLNCKCIVILDESQKNNKLLSIMENEYCATIEFHGTTWNEADEYAIKLCSNNNNNNSSICYVPMFDHTAIFTGHSSIIGELYEEYNLGYGGINDNYPDCIICSVGGGGLLNGILSGLYQVGWSRCCKIIAAQSENAALFDAGINNSYQSIPVETITCGGINLGYRAISNKTMELTNKYSKFNEIKSIIVLDADVLNICTLFAEKQHILIEPLCGVAITAYYKNKQYFAQFKNICIIVCGGNHIYYNINLLNESINNGTFNDKPTEFAPKTSYGNLKQFHDYDEKTDEIDEEDLNAYDSATEEM